MSRLSTTRYTASVLIVCSLLFSHSVASAQTDPVVIYPLPDSHTWTAILGAANMDFDPADEIVVIDEDQQLVIVDSSTGEIQFDSAPYGWKGVYGPGWNRELSENYARNHGYDVFCDEDGDGIYCINVLVSDISVYEYKFAVICLDRNPTNDQDIDQSSQLYLRQNFPNPLGPSTQIDFSMTNEGRAVLEVYDSQGRLVRKLLDQEKTAGDHTVFWDGKNDRGVSVASGAYYYELEVGGQRTARKSLVLR